MGGEEWGTHEVKLSTLLPLHQAAPPSLQVPSRPWYQDNAGRGKGKAEGPPVGDEVYNICICLEMP